MNVTILSVSILTKPTKTPGKTYQVADVAYKNNSFQGKVEGKQVMAFGVTKASFDALAVAQPGETYEVEVVKNTAGYNDWVSMTKAGAQSASNATAAASGYVAGKASPIKSNYEPTEERAQRQVYIVRQSSIANAIATLSVGSKKLEGADVVDLAKFYTDYVLSGTGSKIVNGGATGFDDVPAIDPEFEVQ